MRGGEPRAADPAGVSPAPDPARQRRPHPSAERLLGHVWGYRGAGDRQLLKQLVHRLRQKIETDAAEPRYLVTVSGVGYALRPEGEE